VDDERASEFDYHHNDLHRDYVTARLLQMSCVKPVTSLSCKAFPRTVLFVVYACSNQVFKLL